MKPDRTNYEIWLIDYLDGNLDKERADLLMIFLEENPDIREELNDLVTYNLKPGEEPFRNKSSLKKTGSQLIKSQFEYLCVAYAENDLTVDQAAELQELVAADTEKRKTFDSIVRLKLEPPVIEFINKNKLRRLTIAQKAVRLSIIGLSAAASLLLIISVFNRQLLENPIIKNNSLAISGVPEKEIIKPVKNDEKILITEIQNIKNKDIKNAGSELHKTSIAVKSPVLSNISDPDSLIRSTPGITNIAIIDFKKDVTLAHTGPEANLITPEFQELKSTGEMTAGFNGFIARLFREKILKSGSPGQGNLKAYEIADAGITGLNRLFGWEMSLQKNKDEKGEVKSVNFNSKLLKFVAPVKKVPPLP